MRRHPRARPASPRYPRFAQFALSTLVCTVACKSYEITSGIPAEPEWPPQPDPCLELDPEVVALGEVTLGGEEATVLTEVFLRNTCRGDLEIYDLYFGEDDTLWDAGTVGSVLVPHDSSTDLTLGFVPWIPGVWDNTLYVESNDPELPVAEVVLFAEVVAE